MRLWSIVCIATVAAAAGVAEVSSAPTESPEWTIVDLGTLGGEGKGAAAINNRYRAGAG